jgi:hypothetical protein
LSNFNRADHVHREHYNAQLVIQHVINDSKTGKTSTDVVRINLTSRESDEPAPDRLEQLRQRVARHLEVAFSDAFDDIEHVLPEHRTLPPGTHTLSGPHHG